MKAGKLNEKILKLFLASGDDKVLSFIQSLNIQLITPVLPTRKFYLTSWLIFNKIVVLKTLSLIDNIYCFQDAVEGFDFVA